MIVFLIFFLYYTTFRPSVVVFGLHLHSRAEHHTHSILSPASGRTRMHQFHHHLHAHKRQRRPDEENSEYINITLHKYITLHDRGTSSPATRSNQTQMVCVCVSGSVPDPVYGERQKVSHKPLPSFYWENV